jgi:hypothetical protein
MTLTVVYKTRISSFNSEWVAPIANQYFSFEPWIPGNSYTRGTLFYINVLDIPRGGYNDFYNHLTELGFKVIIDNLWEPNLGPVTGALQVCCDRWFWYNESLWYSHWGLDKYQPFRDIKYLALMPINNRKLHRDDFVSRVRCDLMLWSYVAAGRQLPNDGDMKNWSTQRYMNPDWYNSTYLSMVVESVVHPRNRYCPVFITEKTIKPLAFRHPFVIYGMQGVLRTLHTWGFETFNNLWDESYDEISDSLARRDAVVELINNIKIWPHNSETCRRIEHNYYHFFDQNIVLAGIFKEIIEPILEYAETN